LIPSNPVIIVPLHMDELGVIYVDNTQITFEVIIRAFLNGALPEQIVEVYDELKLADVYAIIVYYLKNIDEMDDYIERAELESPSRSQVIEIHNSNFVEERRRLLTQLRANKRRY
jgi:uncharacterized protein (DUF433 family)